MVGPVLLQLPVIQLVQLQQFPNANEVHMKEE